MCSCLTRRRTLGLLVVAAAFPLQGCFEGDQTGPEDVHWDRDACALCNMLISDPRFTAQVRGGPKKKLYKFDDIGCAINWLNDKPWAGDEATEIWVAELDSTREKVIWLKARDAHYLSGELTPMNYGFGAVSDPGLGRMDFVQLTNKILAEKPNHICTVPERSGS